MYRRGATPVGTCPRCREALLPVASVAGVRYCDRCGGVFADLAASTRIVTALDRELLEVGFLASRGKPEVKESPLPLTCPECTMDMVRTRVESAACSVDACPVHGTFFDAHELERVMRAYVGARRARVGAGTSARRSSPPETAEDRAWVRAAISGLALQYAHGVTFDALDEGPRRIEHVVAVVEGGRDEARPKALYVRLKADVRGWHRFSLDETGSAVWDVAERVLDGDARADVRRVDLASPWGVVGLRLDSVRARPRGQAGLPFLRFEVEGGAAFELSYENEADPSSGSILVLAPR